MSMTSGVLSVHADSHADLLQRWRQRTQKLPSLPTGIAVVAGQAKDQWPFYKWRHVSPLTNAQSH